MRDWYEFNRDAIKAFLKRPIKGTVEFLFIALVFYLLYITLWIVCPC